MKLHVQSTMIEFKNNMMMSRSFLIWVQYMMLNRQCDLLGNVALPFAVISFKDVLELVDYLHAYNDARVRGRNGDDGMFDDGSQVRKVGRDIKRRQWYGVGYSAVVVLQRRLQVEYPCLVIANKP